ncbi:MAG: MBOAT family protein [Treponemataceae bacterium]|nr:MAG: MBOAT family protein [Treponemataceae bacterium]
MLFSSNIFLFLFLPAVLVGYFLLHNRTLRNVFLFFASLFFYAWGEVYFVFAMLAVIVFNFRLAMLIDAKRDTRSAKKLLLFIAIAGDLSLLFYYKYFDFAITTLNRFILPAEYAFPLRNIALPIGISFFTFQAISYVIDVYRGTVPVQTKFIHIGLYISLFPQLIAGPIVRYGTIAEEIERRKETFGDFSYGVRRFIIGFGKKMLLANNMAIIADSAFSTGDAERSVAFAWLGALSYSLQILFDFSGYSDMAIGLGRMFGFKFLENFNYPYISRSVSEFWRRWHISLGSWFRDYVYVPLGGSRVKTPRLIFNLLVVWVLTGIWHGASWHFAAWGLLYFVLITFEKMTGLPANLKSVPAKVVYRFLVLLAILGGWVLFRADGLRAAVKYAFSMAGMRDNPLICDAAIGMFRDYRFFLLFALLCATPIFSVIKTGLEKTAVGRGMTAFSAALYLFIFVWSFSFIVVGAHNPFIYFNF